MSMERYVSDLPIREFVGTPHGIDLLEANADLQGAVADFVTAENQASFAGHELIGEGSLGQVRAVAGTAIKVATPYTNKLPAYRLPKGERYADNLVNQFMFLTALDRRVSQRSDGRVSVPSQYFALITDQGSSLLVQEHVQNSQTLEAWGKNTKSYAERSTVNRTIKAHIQRAVGLSVLKLGLLDLVDASPYYVNGGNILVRSGAEYPPDEPFKIIDQPGPGPIGRHAASMAQAHLRRNSRRGEPLVRSLVA